MKNIIITLITGLFLFSCGNKKINEEQASTATVEQTVTLTAAQLKNAGIQTGKAETRKISALLKVNGKIDVPPQNMVSVSMPLGGFLRSTSLLPGMHVKKGEVIATMEDEQYIQLQQDYLTARAKLIYLESEFNRQKELNQSKASSDKVFQQTQMDFNSQKITCSALGEKLKLINIKPETLNENNLSKSTSIYSPIDGFVSKVNVNIGKFVNPSDIIFELINPDDIHLNLKIFEKDLEKLSIGQNLIAYNNNQTNKKYPCKIILISQDLSEDRSVEVHCHFEAYDKTLLPGMYMNAEIEVTSNNALTINDDAIVSFEGKEFIFIEKGSAIFEMTEIKKGNTENGYTEVYAANNGNLKDKQIVIKGAYSILMHLKNEAE